MANVLQRQASVVPVLLGLDLAPVVHSIIIISTIPRRRSSSTRRLGLRFDHHHQPRPARLELVMVGAGEQRAAAVT
jgi:hypothetical protein